MEKIKQCIILHMLESHKYFIGLIEFQSSVMDGLVELFSLDYTTLLIY